MKPNLLIILGPTASGKTSLAVNVAARLNGEIISADSRQVFRGMDIGTGKDLSAYELNGSQIPYHLIDILDAGEKYNVNTFKEDFYSAFESVASRGKLPVLCGGTGMYIHALLQRQDLTAVPVNHTLRLTLEMLSKQELLKMIRSYPAHLTGHADISSHKRMVRAVEVAEFLKYNKLEEKDWPALFPCITGLYLEREQLRNQIWDRLQARLADGLVAETEQLLDNGVAPEMLSFYGLEYKYIMLYLTGSLNIEQMKAQLYTAICQYAKRQVTFFKKMEKDGVKINWLNAADGLEILTEKVISLKENTIIMV